MARWLIITGIVVATIAVLFMWGTAGSDAWLVGLGLIGAGVFVWWWQRPMREGRTGR